jgi:hypothetical protein
MFGITVELGLPGPVIVIIITSTITIIIISSPPPLQAPSS